MQRNFQAQYGPWAMVTGASSGIGKEFAVQLAERGMNLVLVARRKSLLDALAHSLRDTKGVQVKIVDADLTLAEGTQRLADATDGLEIGLLVSNAGAEIHGPFLDQDPALGAGLIQLHAITPMWLAHYYGGLMRQLGRGGIIFVSSVTGFGGTPYLTTYSATKAYLLNFGESLHYELKKHNIDVTVLAPGITRTALTENAARSGVNFSRIPLPWMEVEPVVTAGLDALGKDSSVVPGTINKLVVFVFRRLLARKRGVNMFGRMLERAISLPRG
jgi:short-subunit dehydrogenase